VMGFILQWDSSILVGRCPYSIECFIAAALTCNNADHAYRSIIMLNFAHLPNFWLPLTGKHAFCKSGKGKSSPWN